jgi:hypothetical protein
MIGLQNGSACALTTLLCALLSYLNVFLRTCCGKLSGSKGCIMYENPSVLVQSHYVAKAQFRAAHTNDGKGDAAATSANDAW